MNVLGLFSGIGGFELGFQRAGFRIAGMCEIDPYCRAVLAKHWPTVPVFEDVRQLDRAALRLFGIRPDVITGGFPCQDISHAGKGAGLAGERSGLWFEYRRIIEEVRPRWAVIENVSALRTRGLEEVLGGLPRSGMTRNGIAFPLPPLARHTGETGSGLLPTPTVSRGGYNWGGGAGRTGPKRPSLDTMARHGLWPTPMAADAGRGSGTFARGNPTLRGAVEMWPTPRANDALKRGALAADPRNGLLAADPRNGLPAAVQIWPTPTAGMWKHTENAAAARFRAQGKDSLPRAVAEDQGVGGQLNPTWVEWLMGFPPGWTVLEPSEMPSSPRSRKSSRRRS